MSYTLTVSAFAGQIQTLFQYNDTNKDGALSFDEFHNGIGLSSGSTALDKLLFDELDTNNDGRVSQTEYISGTFAALRGDLWEDENNHHITKITLSTYSYETFTTLLEEQQKQISSDSFIDNIT